MKLCSTGFAGIDLLHLSKLVNLVGKSSGHPALRLLNQ